MTGVADLRRGAVRSFVGAQVQKACDPYIDLIAKEIEEAIPAEGGADRQKGRQNPQGARYDPGLFLGYA